MGVHPFLEEYPDQKRVNFAARTHMQPACQLENGVLDTVNAVRGARVSQASKADCDRIDFG
jgi:hypothetical protein